MQTPENLAQSLSEITSTFEFAWNLAKESAKDGEHHEATNLRLLAALMTIKSLLAYLQAKEQQSLGRGE